MGKSNMMGDIVNLIGTGIYSYNNLSPIKSTEGLEADAMQLGNSNYQLGSLQVLADQYANRNIPQPVTRNDLYNPSFKERFGQLFSSGMAGYQAGIDFMDNFGLEGKMGTSFIKGRTGFNTNTQTGWGPDKNKSLGNVLEGQRKGNTSDFTVDEIRDAFGKPEYFEKGTYAGGGFLELNNGAMIDAAVGSANAAINMGLNEIGDAMRRKQARTDALSATALRDFSLTRNQLDFQRAVDDSTDNMFDTLALQLKAYGGPIHTNGGIWSNGVTFINNGGSHEQNPYEGVQMGIAPDGKPNLVEEGEAIYDDYVFSRRLKVPKKDYTMLGLKGKKTYSYADAAEILQRESKERPNDPISKKNIEALFGRLQQSQETYKQERDAKMMQQAFASLSPEEQNYLMQSMEYPSQQMPMQYATGGRLFAGESLSYTSPDTEDWTNAEVNRKFEIGKKGRTNYQHVHANDYIKVINSVLDELNNSRGVYDPNYDVDKDPYITLGYTDLDAIQELYEAYKTFTTEEQYKGLFDKLNSRLGKKFSFNPDFDFDINNLKHDIVIRNILETAIDEYLAEDLYTKEYLSKLTDLGKKAKEEGREPTEEEYNQIRQSAIDAFFNYKYKYGKSDTERSTHLTLENGKIKGDDKDPFWYYANKIAWTKPEYSDYEFPEILVTAKRKEEDKAKKSSVSPESKSKPTPKPEEESAVISTPKKEKEGKGTVKKEEVPKIEEEIEEEEGIRPEGIKVGPTIGSVNPFDTTLENPFTDPFKFNHQYDWWKKNKWKPAINTELPDLKEIEEPEIKEDLIIKKEPMTVKKEKPKVKGDVELDDVKLRDGKLRDVDGLEDNDKINETTDTNTNLGMQGLMGANQFFRYIAALAPGLVSNKVDYTNPNLIGKATKNINFIPLGDYLSLPRLPFASTIGNKMQAQQAATNAAIQNVAANRAAAIPSLLTSNYQGQTTLADAALEAAKYNNILAQTEAEFNRGTNQANLTAGLDVAKTNQQLNYDSAVKQASMRELIDQYISEANSTNATTLLDNIQNMSKEAYAMEEAKKTAAALGAYGGKLKRKKKKGLTC